MNARRPDDGRVIDARELVDGEHVSFVTLIPIHLDVSGLFPERQSVMDEKIDLQKMKLEEGDLLFVRVPKHLPMAQVNKVREQIRTILDEQLKLTRVCALVVAADAGDLDFVGLRRADAADFLGPLGERVTQLEEVIKTVRVDQRWLGEVSDSLGLAPPLQKLTEHDAMVVSTQMVKMISDRITKLEALAAGVVDREQLDDATTSALTSVAAKIHTLQKRLEQLEGCSYAGDPTITTFDELVAEGIRQGVPCHNGMPWSFTWRGVPVTHERDDLYLVCPPGVTLRMGKGDVLFTNPQGELCVGDAATMQADRFDPVVTPEDSAAAKRAMARFHAELARQRGGWAFTCEGKKYLAPNECVTGALLNQLIGVKKGVQLYLRCGADDMAVLPGSVIQFTSFEHEPEFYLVRTDITGG